MAAIAKLEPVDEAKLWHAQPGESHLAYQRFVAYLAMGPRRTVEAVAQTFGLHVNTVYRQSSQYHWADRAKVYDQEIANTALSSLEDVRDQIRDRLLAEAPLYLETLSNCARGQYPCEKPALALQAAIKA